MIRSAFFVVILILSIGCKSQSKDDDEKLPKEVQFENQIGYVNDYADVFTIAQENELEKIFESYDNETTNEVGVVTIKETMPFDDINDFNDALLKNWRFGKDDKYNGLLILINKNERKISIRFGSGIQSKISDEETQKMIDEIITPEFKKGQYYQGILNGFNAIKKELK